MDKKGFANIILIIFVLLVIGVVGYFRFVRKSVPVAQNSNNLISRVTDWNSYTNTDISYQSVAGCEDGTDAQQKVQKDYADHIILDKKSVKDIKIDSPELLLNVHYSPNYLHWTPEEFLSFYDCSSFPTDALYAYPDKLLWIDGGSLVKNSLTGDPVIDQKLKDEEKIRENDINLIKEYFKSQISTTIPTDETADWKTYTNTQYGFKIKYPNDFNDSATQILASNDLDGVQGDFLKVSFPKSYSEGTNLGGATIFAGAKNVSESECWKIYGNDVSAYGSGENRYENVVINGVSFRKATVGDAGAGNSYTTTRYATIHNSICYLVIMVAHSYNDPTVTYYDSNKLAGVFDKILSTFKFIK